MCGAAFTLMSASRHTPHPLHAQPPCPAHLVKVALGCHARRCLHRRRQRCVVAEHDETPL
eukprot:131632-Chlamydomonas_euryale.AAC.1